MSNTTSLDDQTFRDLLDLVMASDPWPLDADSERRIKSVLTDEAFKRDYEGWVEAYHEVNP